MLRLYRLALWLLLPIVPLRLRWRARRQPEYLEHVGERFGRYAGGAPVAGPTIWLHAVSLGETRAAQPLVQALLDSRPDTRILLTSMTPTGRAEAERLFGDRVRIAYLPYDYPLFVRRFLEHFAPRAGIFIETEIWPNLIRECNRAAVPLALVSARLSERSLSKARRLAGLAGPALAGFAVIGAQTAGDAARLAGLGIAAPTVTGNLKFDMALDQAQIDAGHAARARLGGRRVLLLANTRDGEEALFLPLLASLPADVLVVLVPRHPQRFDAVAAMLGATGSAVRRRFEGQDPDPSTRVLLGDTLGEMPYYYAMADVAVVAGSFEPLGGHNLIEACAVGTPVIVGPHTFNFAQAVDDAIAAGAALRSRDAAVALELARELLDDPARRDAMSRAGQAFAAAHRGATARTMELIRPLIG